MRRYSRLARDLHVIHGDADVRVISDEEFPIPRATGLGILIMAGLWVVVAALAVVAMLILIAIFSYSAFVPHPSLDADLISKSLRPVFA